MYSGSIPIDFDVFKAITARRAQPSISENDVLREVFGLPPAPSGEHSRDAIRNKGWLSEGVLFPLGTQLQHRFRDGRLVHAQIAANGVEYEGVVYPGLSPAAAAATGHQVNGWRFWEVPSGNGWRKVDALRQA